MTTAKSIWTASDIKLFSTYSEIFIHDNVTGQTGHNLSKDNWRKLMSCIAELTHTASVNKEHVHCKFNSLNSASGLKPILTWPGGKRRELKHILPNVPSYDRFFEPFVGGGSVFMGINAKEYFINDFSSDLVSVYRYIASSDAHFLNYLEMIDMSLRRADEFLSRKQDELIELYTQYYCECIEVNDLICVIGNWCQNNGCDILNILDSLNSLPCVLVKQLKAQLYKRFKAMKDSDTTDIPKIKNKIEVAVKEALFNNYLALYNDITVENSYLHAALFVYIREYSFRAMFKYKKNGTSCESFGFNLDNKLQPQLKYYKSKEVAEHFNHTHISKMDFEQFLIESNPTEKDFIFLDPPYDETFSTYDKHIFGKEDHCRLADYLLKICKAKWMMIIKNTDFIYSLYNKPGIHIHYYSYKYAMSNKGTQHLLITNYPLADDIELPILAA